AHKTISVRRQRILLVCLAVIAWSCSLAGCRSGAASLPSGSPTDEDTAATVKKDRMALRRIERDPPACTSSDECPGGSHCDAASSTCRWQCITDTDCGPEARCTSSGTCEASARRTILPRSDNSSSACQLVSIADRIQALTTLSDDQITCPN